MSDNQMTPSVPGKSLINEVEKLREAVLLLCELQKELTVRIEEALTTIKEEAAL